MLKLQFATDESQQIALQRQATEKLNWPASDWQATYSYMQTVLAPILSCPAFGEIASVEYSLGKDQRQELARWKEFSLVP